jgi:hypothetical protein
MQKPEEITAGITKLREQIERNGTLKVKHTARLGDRRAHYFLIGVGSKSVDFVLTQEFLSDLPSSQEYQGFVEEYVDGVEHRIEQPSPMDFYCGSGTAFSLEVHWPISPMVNRAASFVPVSLEDIRMPTFIARFVATFVYSGDDRLSRNPFARQAAIVNRARRAVDQQEIAFYARAAHPVELQELLIRLDGEPAVGGGQVDLEQYLAGKVYWLGFKRSDKDAKVWA